METIAGDSGMGVPALDEKSNGRLKAIQRRREQTEKLDIRPRAIPEIALEGEEVDVRSDELVTTLF